MSIEFEDKSIPSERGPLVQKLEDDPDADFDLVDNEDYYKAFFKACEANRDLLVNIRIIVPVRPADGINVRLAQMLTVWRGEGVSWAPLNDHMGGFIECTRASIAHTFKHSDTEKFLIMIDNDMEPTLWLPLLLARHDKPVVGGCAIAVMHEFGPSLCFTVKDSEGHYRFPSMRMGKKIPHSGLVEAGHIGTGAICIRRDVFDQFTFTGDDCPFLVPESARRRGMSEGKIDVGEDIAFCNQLRQKGIPMYVDLEAHLGHRKTVSMRWDDDLRDKSMDAATWVLPPFGKIVRTST